MSTNSSVFLAFFLIYSETHNNDVNHLTQQKQSFYLIFLIKNWFWYSSYDEYLLFFLLCLQTLNFAFLFTVLKRFLGVKV